MVSETAENDRARLGIKGGELYGVAENKSDDDDKN